MPAKPNTPQRIVFIGAECTGKTTLVETVAQKLDAPWSREYVREYADQLDRALEARDLDPIARGQLKGEDQAAGEAQGIVLHDTNLLSSILYAEHYFDVHIPWVDELFIERDYDRYFLCMPDIPWVADPGQRVSSAERAKLHSRFEEILSRYDIQAIPLQGSVDQRIQTVMTNLHPDGKASCED